MPGFEHRDALMQAVILFARLLRHLAHNLEIFALHDAHIVEDPFDLRLHQRIDLAPDALGGAGRIGRKLGEFIKKPGRCRGHGGTLLSPFN